MNNLQENLYFSSFSSGSSGNSYLVKTPNTAIIIDAGISGKKILQGLSHTETMVESVRAVLVTHEHSDHTKSLKVLCKKLPFALTCANSGTWRALEGMVPPEKQLMFETGDRFTIGDIEVKSFAISHDTTDPVAYSLFAGGRQVSILTDTGKVTPEIFNEIKDADLLVLEANHDVNLINICRYPWNIKQRIKGTWGHLSNEDAGNTLCKILDCGQKNRRVLLAHLSKESNFPELAQATIKNILEENGHFPGESLEMGFLLRDEISPLYKV